MAAEVLIGNEWIVVEESPAELRDAVSDDGNAEISLLAPMANWVALTLPTHEHHSRRMMRVALSKIYAIRWHDSDCEP